MCPDQRRCLQVIDANFTVYPAKQRGAGLPLAIFLITVMALIATTLAQLQQTTGEMEAQDIQSGRAFYAAESGAQLALTRIIPKDPDMSIDTAACTMGLYQQTFSVGSLSGCEVNVDCESVSSSDGPVATLRSKGSCGSGLDSAQRQIEVRAQ